MLMPHYDAAIARNEIQDDPLQRNILQHMERLAYDLAKPKRWFPMLEAQVIQGIYLFGPVGAGKTYLVDLFFEHIQEARKARFHFHHFMQQVDAQLRQLQGKKNPLEQVARNIAKSVRVLCFDEFLIHDVAYALILADLLQALIAQGVILVISSNTIPDELYRNGVHRERFLPAIAAIKRHCEVLKLDEPQDYRLGREPSIHTYLHPLNEQTNREMERQFNDLGPADHGGTVVIQNRDIPYLKKGNSFIWFAFNTLCNLPRSQLDYLEIAEKYDTIYLSGIPKLTEGHTLQTIMFIHFIDVMYDRGIHVVLSAEVPIDALYLQGELLDTFKRTQSRLHEMQSVDYLKRRPKRVLSVISN